ncbi:MAG: ABC transporter substrate-binding protein, partial [Proteiniphilum sp.]|nr:ABC transporter substrate-binding protein [Proteiniphilum sp.]
IKLIAEFVDKREQASSLFDDIENRYNDYIDIAKVIKQKPTILSGDNFQDTWYVPGGDSFNAHYFNDAGANYYYKNDKTNGSIGLDIESILVQFGDADVWIDCEANSYTELINKDRKYNLLKAVKNKRVFNNRNRTTATGGNDYFESAIANPDLILRDIIKALHPDMFQDNQFTYLKPLK